MRSVLYPGAFKPPHRGHFEVVKRLLNNTHGGHPYDIDSHKEAGAAALGGKESKADQIDKVYIFIGGGERNGLTKEEAMAVWNIYAKYLPGAVIMDGEKNPMFAAKDFAKENSEQEFYAVTGVRGEEDFVDLRRVTTFKNRENVDGLVMAANADSKVRATDFRNAILSGNLDLIIDFFPAELKREEILKIVNMLKQSIIAEMMGGDLDNLLDGMFITEEVEEGSSGTAIAPKSGMRSDDRAKLIRVYERLRDLLGDDKPACELNHAPEAGIHFGFPYWHQGDIPDPEFGDQYPRDNFKEPMYKFEPHSAPLGLRFYQGEMFPEKYRGNLIVAQHGSWNRSPAAGHTGYQLSFIDINDDKVVNSEIFADGWLDVEENKGWGKPVDILEMPDGSILVSDDVNHCIYRITYSD